MEQLAASAANSPTSYLVNVFTILVILDMEAQKSRLKILNALPIGALSVNEATLVVREVKQEEARQIAQNVTIESYIGHPSTAKALSEILGKEVTVNRSEARLHVGDLLLVAVLTRRVTGDQEIRPEDLRLFIVEIK